MNKSLGALLALCLAGLQFLAVLLVVSSSFVTSESALIRHARDLLRDVAVNASVHSKGFLSPAEGAAELAARLAENQVVTSANPELLEQLLFQQLQIAPQFAGLYFGGSDGAFVFVMRTPNGPGPFRSKIISGEGVERRVQLIWRDDHFNVVARMLDNGDMFDPRTRSWYQGASREQSTVWTDPYIFFSSQMPGITLAAPVLNRDGTLHGAIGVDIEIEMISHFLSRLNIGESGKALILNKNGDVIAHPDPSLLRTRDQDGTLRFVNIREFGDPIAQAAFGGLVGEDGVTVAEETPSQFTYLGARYVSTLMPLLSEQLPWTIAVYAPEDDFTSVIKANREQNIWIAAGVAVMTGLLGLLLANRINRPIRAFARNSVEMARDGGDPEGPQPKTYLELERANATLAREIMARRGAESEFGQTFDQLNRGMAQISAKDGSILRANRKFGEILGLDPEAARGKLLQDVAHPDDFGVQHCLSRVLAEDSAPNWEMRWLRRDGKMIWVRLNSIPIHSARGELLHGFLTVDDITEEKSREGEIAQLNRDLSHLARGHTMGQMASGLAHELNQPLAAIAQNADAALHALGKGDAAGELRDILGEIESQSLRAGDIIRALRGFIRKDENIKEPFDFVELLDQTLGLVQAEANQASVAIETALAPDVPQLFGNRVQIAQILVNLLRNAIEAMRGTPTLAQGHRVWVTAQAGADGIEIAVCDNGPGVADGQKLFTPFETSKPEGMGLGLSICRTLAQANGGEIWHESQEGRGSVFCLRLPRANVA